MATTQPSLNCNTAVAAWLESKHDSTPPEFTFTSKDIYDDIWGTFPTRSKPHSFYKQIGIVLSRECTLRNICKRKDKFGAEFTYWFLHRTGLGTAFEASPSFTPPIAEQPEIWHYMHSMSGWSKQQNQIDYAWTQHPIEPFAHTVLSIWKARMSERDHYPDRMFMSYGSSLGGHNTLAVRNGRGGPSSDS